MMNFELCWFDWPSLVVLLLATVWFFKKRHKLKEEKENLESQLSE